MGTRANHQAASCKGKVPYETRKQARTAAASTRKRARFPGSQAAKAYRCTACGFYHVGRPTRTKDRLHQRGVDPDA